MGEREVIPDTDQRHWSFTAGRFNPRPQCPTCLRAKEFGMAGNWWCRPCTQRALAPTQPRATPTTESNDGE